MPCPKNRNARVLNIPLKSEKTVLVSQLTCVSHISYTATIAEKISRDCDTLLRMCSNLISVPANSFSRLAFW